LMSRSLSGEATPQEREQLMEELKHQSILLQQYEMMRRMWEGQNEAAKPAQPGPVEAARISRILQLSAAEQAAQQTEAAVTVPARVTRLLHRQKLYGKVALAAGLLLGLFGAAYWYKTAHTTAPSNEIIAKRGSKTRTILPDGSTVWLNAGSRIQYEPGFNGAVREVTLQGEAFFDVVKIPSRPFIVHAGEINIKVLGTAFDVKSYDEDKTIETTLIRGLVQITRAGGQQQAPILLHPHQKIVLPRKDIDGTVANAGKPAGAAMPAGRLARIIPIDSSMKEDVRVETSWVYNRLEFRGDRFNELAHKLERWYNIDIHFEDDAAQELSFNGSLENETMEQAFTELAAAVPFQFKISNNEVYIRSADKPVPGVTHR